MRVLAAMSGGVDSSVAAAELKAAGHEVMGVTMKLWGGPSDTGCCSVSDVDDARRVAQQLGIAHHVFNFSDEFARAVVEPYVGDHAGGLTPNPCIECNRHLKFDRLLRRALQLGYDALATGHHARIRHGPEGTWSLLRGEDTAKDQSYVLHMLGQDQLSRVLLPVGELTKEEVRRRAARLGLRTAAKPDSQDVCFISRADGREAFLRRRIELRPATALDEAGSVLGVLPAIELLTIGQRRGLGHLAAAGGDAHAGETETSGGTARAVERTPGSRRYVVSIDTGTRTVLVGGIDALQSSEIALRDVAWVAGPPFGGELLEIQTSAHGRTVPGRWTPGGAPGGRVALEAPARRVSPGQSVVLYRADAVVGGGTVAA